MAALKGKQALAEDVSCKQEVIGHRFMIAANSIRCEKLGRAVLE